MPDGGHGARFVLVSFGQQRVGVAMAGAVIVGQWADVAVCEIGPACVSLIVGVIARVRLRPEGEPQFGFGTRQRDRGC